MGELLRELLNIHWICLFLSVFSLPTRRGSNSLPTLSFHDMILGVFTFSHLGSTATSSRIWTRTTSTFALCEWGTWRGRHTPCPSLVGLSSLLETLNRQQLHPHRPQPLQLSLRIITLAVTPLPTRTLAPPITLSSPHSTLTTNCPPLRHPPHILSNQWALWIKSLGTPSSSWTAENVRHSTTISIGVMTHLLAIVIIQVTPRTPVPTILPTTTLKQIWEPL